MPLKFKVGDRVRLKPVAKDAGYSVDGGGLGTIQKVDDEDDELPYEVKWDGDTGDWAYAADLQPASRTTEAIRAEIAALEAELAESAQLTTFKVGDKVRIDLVGEITEVDDDLPYRVFFPGMEDLSCPYFPYSVLTKVQQ